MDCGKRHKRLDSGCPAQVTPIQQLNNVFAQQVLIEHVFMHYVTHLHSIFYDAVNRLLETLWLKIIQSN